MLSFGNRWSALCGLGDQALDRYRSAQDERQPGGIRFGMGSLGDRGQA